MGRKTHIIAAVAALVGLAACGKSDDSSIEDQPLEPILPAEETKPISEPNAPAYVGVWSADPEWCASAPGSADPGPVAFTEGEFIGFENICRIGYAAEGTDGGWRLEMICESEGIEYTDVVEVDVDGEILRMRREDQDETIFTRCIEA